MASASFPESAGRHTMATGALSSLEPTNASHHPSACCSRNLVSTIGRKYTSSVTPHVSRYSSLPGAMAFTR